MNINYNFKSNNIIENFDYITNDIVENLKDSIINFDDKILLNSPCKVEINYNIIPIKKISNKEKLKHLKNFKKIKEDDKIIDEKCSICLNEFKTGEYKRELFCGHTFHKKCIDKWLLKSNKMTCPLCKNCNLPKSLQDLENSTLSFENMVNYLENIININ